MLALWKVGYEWGPRGWEYEGKLSSERRELGLFRGKGDDDVGIKREQLNERLRSYVLSQI